MSSVFKSNGIVYLNEDEWEEEGLRAKYPEAQLAKTYEKVYGVGNQTYTESFEHNGMNRRQRRTKSKKRMPHA